MVKNNLTCSGDGCQVRPVCEKFNRWLDNEEREYLEIEPRFKGGKCEDFEREDRYYGG